MNSFFANIISEVEDVVRKQYIVGIGELKNENPLALKSVKLVEKA